MHEGLHQLKSCTVDETRMEAIADESPAALGALDALQILRKLGEGLLGSGEASGLESSADSLKVLA